ncbi:DNA helicase-2/ATP-dependent DNA helicase PcrA [Anaerotaenia torta]|uniref:ATP-dependent helicase n=1 Tax=Anaerotaenia torta TaxID=433293 RepID=UPI003D1AEDF0
MNREMNQAQQQAVLHRDGPMLVLAGPGSGKTLVITERTKRLIEDEGIPEEQILVITFTKAAAGEMKDRFLKIRGTERTRVNFGTFHAVFFTILKHAYHLNAGNIIKDDMRFQFMKEIIHQYGLEYDDEKEFISDLFSEISLVKGGRMELGNYYSISCADEIFRGIYTDYQQRLAKLNLIDFDDMLLLCYELLVKRRDILELWQKKFCYILIDEFQDINAVQYDIVRMLALPQNNLFIVGDDDQSIYRFRGAKPEIMLNFPKDYPNCDRILLDQNYRSTPAILQAAGKLVKHNKNRFDKQVCAVRQSGNEITIRHFNTLSEENQGLAQEIRRLNKEGISFSGMAVLIRTSLGSGAILHKLMEYNLPFVMKDALPNLFEHWIARDILAYLRLAAGRTDRSLYLQIINRPKRYVNRECFDRPEVDFEAVKDYYEDKEWMLERLTQFEYDLALLERMNPYAAVNYIRKGIGYEDYLREYAGQRRIRVEELMDILDELQESAREFKTCEEWFHHMEEYREELKKQAGEARQKDTDSITITTMHGSKGLEFRAVFLMDANEGITPHKKALLEADLEEERRLFYVAMTRAMEHLYIFSAKERYNKVSSWSRFIDEIREPEETKPGREGT